MSFDTLLTSSSPDLPSPPLQISTGGPDIPEQAGGATWHLPSSPKANAGHYMPSTFSSGGGRNVVPALCPPRVPPPLPLASTPVVTIRTARSALTSQEDAAVSDVYHSASGAVSARGSAGGNSASRAAAAAEAAFLSTGGMRKSVDDQIARYRSLSQTGPEGLSNCGSREGGGGGTRRRRRLRPSSLTGEGDCQIRLLVVDDDPGGETRTGTLDTAFVDCSHASCQS